MNIEKKYKLQTKKLERAKNKIENLQTEIAQNKCDSDKVIALIIELSSIQAEWELLIEDLRKQKAEYSALIKQLCSLRKGTQQH